MFDSGHKAIFEPDSEQFTDYGKWIFSTLAWEISRYASFNIELEGHTERGRPPLRENYGNWELSSGRANAARRALLEHGVRGGQIRKVAGFADTMPMAEAEPEDAANRRVTVMLRIRANGGSPPP